jgi:hypothetical protein
MIKLEWNSDLERYQANVDGHLVEVDGDTFAENLQEMRDNLVEEKHLDKEVAEQKAFDELIDASTWTADMHGVSIDGKFECSCCQ